MAKTIDRRLTDAVCRNDFRTFLQAMFNVYAPGDTFVPGWYIDAIGHHLSEVAAGRIKRLIINIPPRYLKSYCASVAFPAWVLGHDPTQQFMCISYSNELSKKHANDFRSLVQSKLYRRLFPGMRLSRAKNTEFEVETTRRGFRLATSTEGTVTGRGANFLIIDDPINANDAFSLLAIDRANQWFKSTAVSRLNSKQTGAIVLVMQRLHVDDLSAELMRSGGWTVLSLPAFATEEQAVPIGPGRYHVRQIGDVLHPEREPKDTLLEMERTVGPATFSAQYQQAPQPVDGQAIDPKWFRYYDQPPPRDDNSSVFLSIDTAAKTSSHNDYSVIIAFQRVDEDYYVLDVVRKRVTFPDLRDLAVALRQRHKAPILVIEDASSGTQLIQDLRATKKLKPIAWRAKESKDVRVYSIQSILAGGHLHLPKDAPWLHAFVQELASYPSRFDDQVDALTTGLLWDQQRKLQEIPRLTCISVSTRDESWGDSPYFSLRNNGLSSDMNHWLHNVGDVAVGGLGSMLDDELGFDGFDDPGDEEQRD